MPGKVLFPNNENLTEYCSKLITSMNEKDTASTGIIIAIVFALIMCYCCLSSSACAYYYYSTQQKKTTTV